MNSKITFTTDEKSASIFVMKIYKAEVEKVWNHFTKADLIDLWWAPKPWKCETKELNFQPNGSWNYAMIGPENEKQFSGAKYNEINFSRSINWTDFFADENGNPKTNLPSSNWLIGFTGVEEGTKVTVNIHFKNTTELHQLLKMGFEKGFKTGLNQLQDLFEENA